MFIHFSIILIISKKLKIKFSQKSYDNLFHSIENNLRELGFGDVAVNKKMKELNKILYDILLKVNKSDTDVVINKDLIIKYFPQLDDLNSKKYELFNQYFINFYHFCFELTPETVIKDALKFKI
jgi:cytochrome b pre-mRNA-processing protein 3